MKRAISYVLIFIGIQLVMGAVVQGVWHLLVKDGGDSSSEAMVASVIAANVVTLIVFLATKWTAVSPHWVQTRPWLVLFWCAIAAMGTIIPSSFFQELMPELPNWAEDSLTQVMDNRLGYFAVGLLAPLAEETVFRGAVLRVLQGSGKPWVPIAISAAFFALIHMNPAQMPHAFLIGLLLGWLYYRTDSIVPGVVFHWVNNTIAFLLYRLYPNADLQLIDLFGTQRNVGLAVAFSLLILLPALYQLNLWMRK